MNRYAFNESISSKEKTYLHKDYLKVIEEYMDMTDNHTRESVMYVNETGQSKVLLALTNKLYDSIVNRVDDIDYGEIPLSKGDITKLSNYSKMVECLSIMRELLVKYKQPTTPIDTINTAINNVVVRRELFEKCFKFNLELPVVLYSSIVMGIVGSLSLMISSCIEFIKTPSQDTFTISIDKTAAAKTMENLLFVNLAKFNNACNKGDVDKTINNLLANKVRGVKEASFDMGKAAKIGLGIVAGLGILSIASLVVLPMLRDLIFFFYYNKTKLSEYFEVQADLLTMNAYNLETNNTMSQEEKDKIIKKQITIAGNFRKLSNKLMVNNKESENKANREIMSTKKMTAIDITNDGGMSNMSLF